MLTADHVRARRRGDRLLLLRLDGKSRTRAIELARRYLQLARAHVGQTREAFDEACAALPLQGWDRRLAAGLLKLVADRCEIDVATDRDPTLLRRELFDRASAARQALGPHETFDRAAILREVAAEHDLKADELEALLYADLRAAHRLQRFAPLSPEQLVANYELAQAQAVLLRATRVVAEIECRSPAALRRLFGKLKFLRLLFRLDRINPTTYRIAIDGPYSLFASVTKYGLQLALALPVIREADHWKLRADLLWGKLRTPLVFELEGVNAQPPATKRRPSKAPDLPDDVTTLLARFRQRNTPWQARPNTDVLALPGVGLCVPDLSFTHRETGTRIYLEVLGYWSREAVWRRIDLVERGLPHRILFAASTRLRVSEAALDDQLSAALYVFKSALQPAAIEQRLDALAQRPTPDQPAASKRRESSKPHASA